MSMHGAPLQMMGVSDIGAVAAEVLNLEAYQDCALSLETAGGPLPTTYIFFGVGLMAMIKDMGYMFKWFHNEGYRADVKENRNIHPSLKDFKTWLETQSKYTVRLT
ncbi:hypothetical protein HAV15_013208 [Penicillium sp. str. |nr:hypothetical protein HAV15_013208 [Penicillium sp. str. \